MPGTTVVEEKEKIKTAIQNLSRGGIPTLEAAKFLLVKVQDEFVKERAKDRSFKDTVKEMSKAVGVMSREEKINEAMFKLGALTLSMEIGIRTLMEIPLEFRKLANDNESTFMQPGMVQRLEKELREIFGVK